MACNQTWCYWKCNRLLCCTFCRLKQRNNLWWSGWIVALICSAGLLFLLSSLLICRMRCYVDIIIAKVSSLVLLTVLIYAQITSMLNWLVRQTSETEIHIVAVERLKEYADEEKEVTTQAWPFQVSSSKHDPASMTVTFFQAAWEIHETVPPSEWPMKGELRFEKYSTRYREGLNLVLRNISCDIRPGEKVCIRHRKEISTDCSRVQLLTFDFC